MIKLPHVPRKMYLLVLVLVVVSVVGAGFLGWKKFSHKSPKPESRRYVSFDGNYMFSVPAQYVANGTAMPGVTVVYLESSTIKNGQSLDDLYAQGALAVEPIRELKDNNSAAFSAYTKDVLAENLRKIFKSATDMRPVQQNGAEAFEIYAIGEGGKRLRANYAVAFSQPVLVVAGDYNDAFKTVGYSMEDLTKSNLKPDIDKAGQMVKEVAQQLQQQNSHELIKNGTTTFKKQMSEKQLVDSFGQSKAYLQRPINIVGGLYDGRSFIAQLVFEAKSQDEQPALGIVSLQKVGRAWKVDGLQLPK